mmetsp:Transcript_5144/g.12901  ORF Transcript_5144/g.12901 Transcript_5144/m.12901 type:complete len:206 (-) Transcript_5144:96-713(-)
MASASLSRHAKARWAGVWAGAGGGGGGGGAGGAGNAAAGASSPSSVSSSAGLAGASSSSSEELKPAVGGAHFRRGGGTDSSSLDEPPAVGGPGGLCVTAGAGLISGVAGAGGRGRRACGGVAGGAAPTRWRFGERSNVTVRRPGRKASMSSPSVSTSWPSLSTSSVVDMRPVRALDMARFGWHSAALSQQIWLAEGSGRRFGLGS